MKPFRHRNFCSKRIFLRNDYVGWRDFFPQKTHILETSRNWKKLRKYEPPKIEKFLTKPAVICMCLQIIITFGHNKLIVGCGFENSFFSSLNKLSGITVYI